MTAYKLYLLFIASYFLHLPARIPVLGSIRFDLLLVLIITSLILFRSGESRNGKKQSVILTEKLLWLLIVYIIISLPFVKWPGSVFFANSQVFIKGIVFFFFTVSLIDNREKLKQLVQVFLGAQIFRVLEPLYLHFTEGYWGSHASMQNWEVMNRLSGAPHDVINPNGLAYVIVTVIPLLHFLFLRDCTRLKIIYFSLLPVLLYALILTGSRTGFVCLLVILLTLFLKSRKKFALISVSVIAFIVAFALMDENQKDRFSSVYKSDTKNAKTAEGRIQGLKDDFGVAMARPIFGHGLGTSQEANYNVRGKDKLSHSLYLELLQELGLIGTAIFLLYMKSILHNFIKTKKIMAVQSNETEYLSGLVEGMQVWLIMNLVFSLASYGLSSYEWYFFGGLSVVVYRTVARAGVENVPVTKRISADVTYR